MRRLYCRFQFNAGAGLLANLPTDERTQSHCLIPWVGEPVRLRQVVHVAVEVQIRRGVVMQWAEHGRDSPRGCDESVRCVDLRQHGIESVEPTATGLDGEQQHQVRRTVLLSAEHRDNVVTLEGEPGLGVLRQEQTHLPVLGLVVHMDGSRPLVAIFQRADRTMKKARVLRADLVDRRGCDPDCIQAIGRLLLWLPDRDDRDPLAGD